MDFLVTAIDNFGDTGFALDLAERLLEKRPGWRIRFFSDDRKLFDRLSAGRLPRGLEYAELAGYESVAPADRIASFFDRKLPESHVAAFPYPKKILQISYLRFDADAPGHPGVGSLDATTYRIGKDTVTHLVPSPLAEGSGIVVDGDSSTTGTFRISDALVPIESVEEVRPVSESVPISDETVASDFVKTSAFCYEPTRKRLPEIEKAGERHLKIWEFANPEAVRPLPFLRFDEYAAALRSFDANVVRGENSAIKAMLAGKPFLWDFYKESNGAHREKIADFLHFMEPFFIQPEDARKYGEAIWAFNAVSFGEFEAGKCSEALSDRSEEWLEAFRRSAKAVRERDFCETVLREWEGGE